jgi:signal transduction histidine kinase
MANSASKIYGDLSELSRCYALSHKRSEPCCDAEHPCPLEEVKKTKKPVTVEHTYYDKDHNARNVEVHGYPIFDSEGNVVEMIEYCIDITDRKRAEEDLRKYREHLEELVETRTGELTQANRQLLQEIEARKGLEKEILNVSEQERRKIGEELHDSLGQQLTGVAFMTKVLEQKLAKKSLNEAADVAEIAQLVNQATNQARSLAKGLHPIDLDTGTLMSTLQDLAESTETLFGIHCTFKCDKRIRVDNPEVAVHLYRITQEAITNAIKHGKAKNIQIDLAYEVNKSVLTVRSDGIDFPKEFEARHTGMGLQIMDHRADIIEGSLDIRKGPKGGTIMTCTFPIKRQ